VFNLILLTNPVARVTLGHTALSKSTRWADNDDDDDDDDDDDADAVDDDDDDDADAVDDDDDDDADAGGPGRGLGVHHERGADASTSEPHLFLQLFHLRLSLPSERQALPLRTGEVPSANVIQNDSVLHTTAVHQ
jgi:hypothetical protein